MTTVALILVLFAALLHATWNALLRSGADRLWSITVMCGASACVALPFAVWLPAPSLESLPYLAISGVLHVAYCIALARAYDRGLLAEVYPIARGSSPLLVAVGGWLIAGETIDPARFAGVVLVSLGILGMALGRISGRTAPLVAALFTGMCIASYTVVDGLGSRHSLQTLSYVAWLCILEALGVMIFYVVARGSIRVDIRERDTWAAIGGGILSASSYAIVVWALTLSEMGVVSALRETSVLFAAAIGRFFMSEPLGARRVVCCASIATGAVVLAI